MFPYLFPDFSPPQRLAQVPIQSANDAFETIVRSETPDRVGITGGLRTSRSLFHSFQSFGLNLNQTADFQTDSGIQNIFARITGGTASVINGRLQVTGSNANLFLMNPSGILFGPNAQLNLPASFTATTANAIGFRPTERSPGVWFNTQDTNEFPGAFSMYGGQPDFFAFSMAKPSPIVNLGNLSVNSGESLFLIGGSIFSTGTLNAPNGLVKAASVPGGQQVEIDRTRNPIKFNALTLSPEFSSFGLPVPGDFSTQDIQSLMVNSGFQDQLKLKTNSDGTLELLATQPLEENVKLPGNQTIVQIDSTNQDSKTLQISSVFENNQGVLQPVGSFDDFGTLILQVNTRRFRIDRSRIQSFDRILETALDEPEPIKPTDPNSEILITFNGNRSLTTEQESNGENAGSTPSVTARASSSDRPSSETDDSNINHSCLANPTPANAPKSTQISPECEKARLFQFGNTERQKGNYQRAIVTYQRAIAISSATSPTPRQQSQNARILNNLAATYEALGNYDRARDLHEQALTLRRSIGDRLGEAISLSNLGIVEQSLGNYPNALNRYQQSLQILRSLNARTAEATVLNNWGLLEESLGQYDAAIARFQEVLAIHEKMQNRFGMSIALNNLGVVARDRQQYTTALNYYQQSLALREKLNDRFALTESLGNIGDIYERLEQFDRALPILQRALQIAQSLGSQSLESEILDSIGNSYAGLNQVSTAIDRYHQALALSRSIGNRPTERQILSNLARLYHGLSQTQDRQRPIAIAFFKQSVNLAEAVRTNLRKLPKSQQDSYLTIVARDYRILADLLLLEGRVLEAQQVLELLKVQEIRSFTRNAQVRDRTVGIATTAAEETILKEHGSLIAFGQTVANCKRSQCAQLSQLNDQLQALTQAYNQTVQTFAPAIRDRRSQDDSFLDPSRFLLRARRIVETRPKTVLIYPLLMKDKLWLVWASQGGVVKSQQIPIDQRQIGEVVVNLRQLLQSPISSPKEVQATSQILYDWLIKPIEGELQANQIENLVFSLDRTTRYIPMAALFDGKQYLVEKYNLSTVLSADLTDLTSRPPLNDKQTETLALGVSESISDFSPLPNVPMELNAIVRQPPEQQGVYPGRKFLNQAFDFRALRDNLLGHRIVHIATHAQFTAGRPEQSFLLLGTGNRLTIPEIQTLQDLSGVQLVVLSACETALGGPDQEGTEISGISSYFLNGGASAVMASLWTVDDASTSELMRSFYQNLSTRSTSKANALRTAQLELIKGAPTQSDYAHPYYWAPFVLTGNAN